MRAFLRTAAKRMRETCRERGQALVLFAAGGAGMIALAGLSVDIGMVVYTRTDLQKVADAAALAGAQELPNAGAANGVAQTYVTRNGGGSTAGDITIGTTHSAGDTISVTARRDVKYTFLRIVGLTGTEVSADAEARAGRYQGGNGLLPFGFIASNDPTSTLLQNPCYAGKDQNGVPQFKQNQLCQIKWGAGNNAGGDFGALGLDGPGANVYRNAIRNGSNKRFKVGDQVSPETGNMAGPTEQGINDRLARSAPAGCPGNGRNDVLITGADGKTRIRPGCEDSARIIIIPVVDQIDHKKKSTILGFSIMYLHGTQNGGPGKGHQEVVAEFIEFTTQLPTGNYDGLDGSGEAVFFLTK